MVIPLFIRLSSVSTTLATIQIIWNFNFPYQFPWPVENLVIGLIQLMTSNINLEHPFIITLPPQSIFSCLETWELVQSVEKNSNSVDFPVIHLPSKTDIPSLGRSHLFNCFEMMISQVVDIWKDHFQNANFMSFIIQEVIYSHQTLLSQSVHAFHSTIF